MDTPKNLTRNILIGLFAGFVVGAIIHYQGFFTESLLVFVQKYIFNLGGDIFLNLLKLIVVPLVFFSLVSGISSLGSMTSLRSITLKTVLLYLATTAIAVSYTHLRAHET